MNKKQRSDGLKNLEREEMLLLMIAGINKETLVIYNPSLLKYCCC